MPSLAAITINHPEWTWPVAGILLAALVLLGFRYASARQMPPGARFAAGALKLLGIALLGICLLDLRWTEGRAEKGANYFLVLADKSRGMEIRDRGGDATRAEVLAKTLSRAGGEGPAQDWQAELESSFEVRRYAFGERLERQESFESLAFDGESSEIRRALTLLRERYRNRPVAGVLLFSDGNATDLSSPADLEKEFSGEGPPIFPVIIGEDAPVVDLGIVEALVSQTIFEDAPVNVQVDVRASGFAGKKTVLRLLDEEGEEVESVSHRVGSDDETHRFRLRLRPVKTGVLFYTLEFGEETDPGGREGEAVRTFPGEATEANNRRTVLVQRPEGPYRILYVTGRPNWEYKFLRRALMVDPQVDMVGLLRLARREPKFEWRGRTGESSNPLFRGFGKEDAEEAAGYDQPVLMRLHTRDARELSDGFPKTAEDLFPEFQALILDDVEAEFFTTDQMRLIEEFVSRRGGGFIMLGGQESFRSGDYAHTPIAQLLPVYLDKIATLESAGNIRFDLTKEGWLEPWLRLHDEEEKERVRLTRMPELRVLNQVSAIKPGASIFAVARDARGKTLPAVVAHRFGEGRVLAVTVGDVWRWGQREEGLHEEMDKSWRQMARWVMANVPRQVAFTAARDASSDGSGAMKLQVRVKDEKFLPRDNAIVKIEVTGPDGAPVELLAEPSLEETGLYEIENPSLVPGSFRAVATVTDENGEALGKAQTGWVTDPAAEEFRRLQPHRALMEELAARSDGEVVPIESLRDFAGDLPEREAPVMEIRSEPLWHTPWVFLAALACFGSEWALRRRFGMA